MMNQEQKPKSFQQSREEELEKNIEDKIEYHQVSSPTVGKKHNWIQKGPEIICTSCESPHGIRIGVNKRLMGFDDKGNMIIKNV